MDSAFDIKVRYDMCKEDKCCYKALLTSGCRKSFFPLVLSETTILQQRPSLTDIFKLSTFDLNSYVTSHIYVPAMTEDYQSVMAQPTLRYTPLSILQSFYDAERIYMSAPETTRDFSGMAKTISPDMKLYQTPALPYGGTYISPDGFQDWSRKMVSHFSAIDVQDPEVFEKEGSDKIVVVSSVRFVARNSGEELRHPLAQIVRVDLEKGVMTEMRLMYWDVAGVNQALGF